MISSNESWGVYFIFHFKYIYMAPQVQTHQLFKQDIMPQNTTLKNKQNQAFALYVFFTA